MVELAPRPTLNMPLPTQSTEPRAGVGHRRPPRAGRTAAAAAALLLLQPPSHAVVAQAQKLRFQVESTVIIFTIKF